MKKFWILTLLLLGFSAVNAERVKIATTASAAVDKVGETENPGWLFKFELPASLQNAQIDLAYLRF